MSVLFSPIELGPYRLSHRVVMAPLTRMRSDPGDIPRDLMVEIRCPARAERRPDHQRSHPGLHSRLWLCRGASPDGRRSLPLAHYDRSTFYGGNRRGYTDYPPFVTQSAA
jgi:hypothetical protein